MTDSKKTKRLSKTKIKKQLLDSVIINEVVESEELNKKAEEIQESEEAAEVIKQYKYIIKTKKKGIISFAYYQGKVFKRFKEKEKFIKLVLFLNLMFLNCVKDNWKSSIGLRFFKNYHKDIKTVSKENEDDFQ